MEDGAALPEILTSKGGEAKTGMRREMEAPGVQSSGQAHGPCNPTSWKSVTNILDEQQKIF